MDKIKQNKTKQAYMNAHGYKVPINGSWGPNQQRIWDRLTLKEKDYDTTITGLMSSIADKITGNTTYRIDPFDSVKQQTTPVSKPQSPVEEALTGSFIPMAIAAFAPTAISTAIKAPLATAAATIGGTVGNNAVNAATKVITGKNYNRFVSDKLNISGKTADYLNLGDVIGGVAGIRRWQNALYSNVTPMGYQNKLTSGLSVSPLSKKQEVQNAVKDFFIPKRIDTNNPKWLRHYENRAMTAEQTKFRDDAWRLAMRQKPRTIIIDGKPQSLYIKNADGTYSYNMDYIKHITGNNNHHIYVDAKNSSLGYDGITSNGGFIHVGKYAPQVDRFIGTSSRGRTYTYQGEPKVTIEDKWDVQPFQDVSDPDRYFSPWFAKQARKYPNNPLVKYIRNADLVEGSLGRPFTLKQTFPEGTVSVYKTDFNKL